MRFPQVGGRMREAPAQALRAMFAGIGQVLLVADRMRSHPAGPDADQHGADQHRADQHGADQHGADLRLVAAPRPVAAENAAARGATSEHLRPAADHPADKAGGRPADIAGGHLADQGASRWRSLDETGNVRILPVSRQTRSTAEPSSAERSAEPARPEPEVIPPAAAGPVTAEPALAEPEPALPEPEPALLEPVSAGPTESAPLPIASYDGLSLASLRARLRNLDSAQLHALISYEQAHAARPDVLGMFERRISKLETGQG